MHVSFHVSFHGEILRIGPLQLAAPLILAPIAGYTDTCARRPALRHGAGLVISEMVSAAGLVRRSRKTFFLLSSHPGESPLGIQIFGAKPEEMSEAARIVDNETSAALIDINMGCPVKKVCRQGAGSALMKAPSQVAKILEEVRRAVTCPVTVKMRLGWDTQDLSFLEIARIAEECGVDAITLHPRTRVQGFHGSADWSRIAELKQERGIPVIGSGDIGSPQEACEALKKELCDGVMIGRAARGNPWIFSQTLELFSGKAPTPTSPMMRHQEALEHVACNLALYGRERGLKKSRFLLVHYGRGLPGSGWFRKQLFRIQTTEDLLALLEEYFLGPLDKDRSPLPRHDDPARDESI